MEIPYKNRICNICQFYEPEDEDFGLCHRYPPIYDSRQSEQCTNFPVTEKFQTCGEWRLDEDEEFKK